jgi:hypothetical protein
MSRCLIGGVGMFKSVPRGSDYSPVSANVESGLPLVHSEREYEVMRTLAVGKPFRRSRGIGWKR